MAKKIRFTIPHLRGLACPEGKSRVFFQDAAQSELLLQVTDAGAKSYYCRVWNPAKRYTEKKPIGKFGAIELKDAKKRAREMAVRIANGEDPDAERKARLQEATFAEAYASFLADPAKRRKRGPRRATTTVGYAHLYAKHIETLLGPKKLSTIDGLEVDVLHSRIGAQSGPHAANRAVSLISCVFNDAIAKGWRGENPARGIEWFPEPSRTRFLQENEIGPFLRACEVARSTRLRTVAEALLLALLTGSRRRNVCGARWDQMDLERRIWSIPGEEMKNGDPHTVYLCDYLHQLLLARRDDQRGSLWVFPSARTEGCLAEPRKGLAAIVKRSGINAGGMSMHCLKHTFMTYADDVGLPSAVRKRLAAHKAGGDVTEGYTHTLERRVREAYEQVAQHMLLIADEEGSASEESVRRPHRLSASA